MSLKITTQIAITSLTDCCFSAIVVQYQYHIALQIDKVLHLEHCVLRGNMDTDENREEILKEFCKVVLDKNRTKK